MPTEEQMAQPINPDLGPEMSLVAQKLLRSFMQFSKVVWHQHQYQNTVQGCKPSEIRLLMVVKRGIKPGASEMKVSEISKMLMVTSPTVTQLLNGLEAEGLIERRIDPHDRRSVGVSLTAKGDEVTQLAYQSMVSRLQGLIDHLGEEESTHLAEILAKVLGYFNEQQTANVRNSQWNGEEGA